MPSRVHVGHLFRLKAVHEISAVTGACLAVERDKFNEVGGFDRAFAVAFNDVDFCLRLQERWYSNLLAPQAVLKHLESASRGRDRGPKRARFEAEAARFRERWRSLVHDDPHYHPLFSTTRFNDWLE
jgi:GT2 family glycosyltransferase